MQIKKSNLSKTSWFGRIMMVHPAEVEGGGYVYIWNSFLITSIWKTVLDETC